MKPLKHGPDPNGAHVRVYNKIIDSPAWRVLSWSARSLYVDLRRDLKGTNNGNISATLSTLKHRGWNSSSTLAKGLAELQALGFLRKTRGGGVESGSKLCSLYAFTDQDIFEHPKQGVEAARASHEYLRYQRVSEAQVARREGMAALREEALSRKRKAAERKIERFKNESVPLQISKQREGRNASITESGSPSALHKVKQTPWTQHVAYTVAS